MKGTTHEHAANILDFAGNRAGECDSNEDQIRGLLEQAVGINSETDTHYCCPSQIIMFDLRDSENDMKTKAFSYAAGASQMVLTREERQRSCGIMQVRRQDASDKLKSTNNRPYETVDGACKQMEDSGMAQDHCNSDTDRHSPQAKLYFDYDWDEQRGVDDSGISLPSTYDMWSLGDRHLAGARSPSPDLGPHSVDENENTCLLSDLGPAVEYQCQQSEWLGFVPEGEITTGYFPCETGQFHFAASGGAEDSVDCVGTRLPFGSHQDISVEASQSRPESLRSAKDALYSYSIAPVPEGSPARSKATVDPHGCLDPATTLSCVGRLPKRPDPTLLGIGFTERSSAVTEFAKMRSKYVSCSEAAVLPGQETVSLPAWRPTDEPSPPEVPMELLDSDTICLPTPRSLPTAQHRYLASMNVIQKQRLIRSLRSAHCSVDLVERDTLGGVDIIIDPHTAILFVPLFTLPSQCVALVTKLGQQSWRYSRLLVIFEAFPEYQSYKQISRELSAPKLYSYSPPIVKAVKKFRRDLNISEACSAKYASCKVNLAFANTVDEAACLTRCFGNFAETNDDTHGAIWGNREWLDDYPHEVITVSLASLLLLMTISLRRTSMILLLLMA
jgi:hypothetical protein